MGKPNTGPDVISLRIPSRLDLLSVLDHVAISLCERMEMPAEESSKVTMSVIEAGTNAIQHGHNRDASKMVDVECTVHPDRRESMDSVDFEFGPHGTICRMVKHRPPAAAEAAGA